MSRPESESTERAMRSRASGMAVAAAFPNVLSGGDHTCEHDNLVSMTSLGKTSSTAGRRPKSHRRRSGQWQLQEAKARFSEVVRRAKQEGPQHVTIHGREEVVVIDADDFRRLAGEPSGRALVDAMRTAPVPTARIDPPRSRMPVRDVDL
jgi:prevent-host-death family protein